MISQIGLPTLLFIILIALLLFGPNKLPELGRAFGKTLREFKKGAKDVLEDEAPRTPQDPAAGPQTGPLMAAKDNGGEDRRLPE